MDFFITNINYIVSTDYFDLPHIILPLGISFFTFTQTAYLVDAYRGEAKNHSFITYCEFVTIFPHLIAGPIINHKIMIPQFIANDTFKINYRNIALGLTIFVIGLFKKVMIADSLSPWVNDVFSHTESTTFIAAWIGAISYTFQLYFDFSGYSEMAIGLGLIFNLTLPMNFNSPYRATSIIDFWRRWHMTLGGWVRNYLYIPMGGNRHGEIAKMGNLFISMMIIGMWHGAGWTFIFWGAMHGVALMINHQWRRLKIKLPKFVNWGLTFLSVMLLWVFFRADSFQSAWNIILSMTDIYNTGIPSSEFYQNHFGFLANYGMSFSPWQIHESVIIVLPTILILFILLLKVPNPLVLLNKEFNLINNKIVPVILGIAFGLILLLINVGTSEFLYFQF